MLKVFRQHELREAEALSARGGQAIHLHRVIVSRRAPRCFVQAVARGEDIAHLFDQDRDRLVRTARRWGVHVIKLERVGEPGQHIDLCGAPLRRALAEAEQASLFPLEDP